MNVTAALHSGARRRCAMPDQCVRCLCCERDLPRFEFHKNALRKTGLRAYCKTCALAANRETRRLRGEPVVPGEKTCSKCRRQLVASEFYRDAAQKPGLTSWCRGCINNKNSNLTRARHEGDPLKNLPADKKYCPRCERVRHVEFFHKSNGKHDGRAGWCRQCCGESQRRFRELHPERVRAVQKRGQLNYRLKKLGITHVAYEGMIATQGNRCAICGSPPADWRARDPVLHIDHCHATGKVRGLLCASCNQGLGFFKDDARRVLLAARYLVKYQKESSL